MERGDHLRGAAVLMREAVRRSGPSRSEGDEELRRLVALLSETQPTVMARAMGITLPLVDFKIIQNMKALFVGRCSYCDILVLLFDFCAIPYLSS